MEGEIEVTKATVECYKIRADREWTWADINIDEIDSRGLIQIASDYGNWSNCWGSFGKGGFKAFLASLDMHYMAGKMGAGNYFDIEKTIEVYRQSITEQKPENREQLLSQCDELEEFDNPDAFKVMMWHKAELMEFFDNCPDMCFTVAPDFECFFKKIWPVLLEEFKKEESL